MPSNRTLRVAATFTRLHRGHGFDSKEDLSKPELQEPTCCMSGPSCDKSSHRWCNMTLEWASTVGIVLRAEECYPSCLKLSV